MIEQRRVLSVQDISCFGKCANTVALPVLSAAGHECVVLPTALLSTHTGGFTGYSFLDLTQEMKKILAHWSTLGLWFDAVQTGYFGSLEQLQIIRDFITRQVGTDAVLCVDPVMGDRGQLYSIYDEAFVRGMRQFVRGADVITPNVTEAALLCGLPYRGQDDLAMVDAYLDGFAGLGVRRAVLTGVYFGQRETGVAAVDFTTGERRVMKTPRLEGYLHGTGDVFASSLCALMLQQKPFMQAVQGALEFTFAAIQATDSVRGQYGLCFESVLGLLTPKNKGVGNPILDKNAVAITAHF